MPDFDDLLLSLTASVLHELDFAFEKNKGDFANALRQRLAVVPGFGWERIEIDEDGDIAVRTKKASVYFTSSTLFMTGWSMTPKELRSGERFAEVSKTIESLFGLRSPLKVISYQARIFFSARFSPLSDPESVLARCSHEALRSVLGGAPPKTSHFSVSAEYLSEPFSDTFEVETSRRNVEVRYVRSANADRFTSYGSFLAASDLNGLVGQLKPLLSDIVMDPSKLIGRFFRSAS